jgi:cardiolipin synthase
MVAAMKRGVKLQIITPGEHIDTETVRAASQARWGELLAAGAEITSTSRRCTTAR